MNFLKCLDKEQVMLKCYALGCVLTLSHTVERRKLCFRSSKGPVTREHYLQCSGSISTKFTTKCFQGFFLEMFIVAHESTDDIVTQQP